MESQPAKPSPAVVRLPLMVPADQAGSWPHNVEALCAPHGVKVRTMVEPGRKMTMFIFEMRGAPEDLQAVQAKLNLLIAAITLTPSRPEKGRRYAIAALSFMLGIGAVVLLFS